MATVQRDLWARGVAVLSLLVGLGGLGWQVATHERSLEERVYVHLSASRNYESSTTIGPGGKLGVEVVNIGEKPVYLKSVTGNFPGVENGPLVRREGTTLATFHGYSPLDPQNSVQKLDPGEQASYTTDWIFAQGPTPVNDVPKFSGTVEVETTTKRFTLQASVSRYEVVLSAPTLTVTIK
jgi:hypothetical protein